MHVVEQSRAERRAARQETGLSYERLLLPKLILFPDESAKFFSVLPEGAPENSPRWSVAQPWERASVPEDQIETL